MKSKSLVLLLGGKGKRCGLNINKVLYKVDNTPLFMYVLKTLSKASFDEYIIVTAEEELSFVKEYVEMLGLCNVKYVLGGLERKDSVYNALKAVTTDLVFIHDGARVILNINDLNNLIASSNNHPCGTLYKDITDTIRTINKPFVTYDRQSVKAISTPQYFNRLCIDRILDNKDAITDEISLFNDLDVGFVKEDYPNLKVTTKEDLEYVIYKLSNNYDYFIGHSLDYHPYSDEGKLILGGVIFDNYKQLLGHSDADVVYHCVTEAIMGASSLGDLGTLFPDNDPKYKGIASSLLLNEVMNKIKEQGFIVQNIDVMVYCLEPKLANYKVMMANNIKQLTNSDFICIKAATLNKHGLIALKEGIGAEATVLLKKLHK